ncbi:MAG: guanylate kinase [Clostridiales bacterium]|nr:guanylate kinase [Clostridiales bacterium]
MEGLLLVVSGPSATGKGTVCKKLVEETDVKLSVSATTREPRPGEVDGVDYFFMTEEEFVKTIEEDGFIEHVQNFGKRYGTPLSYVKSELSSGRDIILEIDVQGAAIIREKLPECILIFLLPPSLEELGERIRRRGTETKEKIDQRLSKAQQEIECIVNYDYYIVNKEVEQAVEDMKSIIKAEHHKLCKDLSEEIINSFKEEKTDALS